MEIDCRGLACPAPVLKTKEAIDKDGLSEITVIVDNEAAKQNVSRFMGTKNYSVSVSENEGLYYISGKAGEEGPESKADETEESLQKIMVMITSDTVGHGDDDLGTKLMASLIKTLKEMGDELWRLIFINGGVKLTIDGADTLEDLKDLENEGIHILVCGTCLTHFDLLDKKMTGETTNMLDIITALQLADKVINV